VWNIIWAIIMIVPLLVDVTRAKYAVAHTLWLMLLPGGLQLASAILTIVLITCQWGNASLLRVTIITYWIDSALYVGATFYAFIIYVTSAYIHVFGTRSSEAVALGHVIAFFIVFPLLTVIQGAFARLMLDTRLRREMLGDKHFDPVVDERSPLGRV